MDSIGSRFGYLVDPSEIEHARAALIKAISEVDGWRAYAKTINDLLIDPIEWWLSKHPDSNALTDAAHELMLAACEIAYRFSEGQTVLPEMVDDLATRWTRFLAWHGYAQTHRIGEQHARASAWQQAGGRSRKGKRSPLHHAVSRLAQRLRTRDSASILAEIERDCAGGSDILDVHSDERDRLHRRT